MMTRLFALPLLTALAGCVANGPADPNPNSVPNVMLSMTQTRQSAEHIFITGGIYDGAAAGQTAAFVVTPDDRVICTFQTDPVLGGDPPEVIRTAHRLVLPGIYDQFAALFVPNVTPAQTELSRNFTVEVRDASGVTSTPTGFGDPRFDRMTDIFFARPTPCWSFG